MANTVPDRSGASRTGKAFKLANPKTCLHGYATKKERDASGATGCQRCDTHAYDLSNEFSQALFGN